MSLKLIDRVATLLRADAHGVIESLEERTLLLKQSVREAEIEVDQKRARLEAIREEESRLRDLLAGYEKEAHALDEDIGLALSGGKDDLARFAVRRLIPRRKEMTVLRGKIDARGAAAAALAERLAAQESQLAGLRTRVQAELARAERIDPPPPWAWEGAVAEEEVELELMRRRRVGEGDR